MFKLVFEKAEEEIKLPTSAGPSKKQESSRKISISPLLTMPKPLTVDHMGNPMGSQKVRHNLVTEQQSVISFYYVLASYLYPSFLFQCSCDI